MSVVKLGDVAIESKEVCKTDKSKYPIVGLEHIIPEEMIVTEMDHPAETSFSKMFRSGDVLFGRRRAYLKKAAVARFAGICSGDITVIRADEKKLCPQLLPFIIQNDDLFDYAVGKSAGSLSPRVKWEHLKNYSFRLPDMQEQERLAEVLWAINDTRVAYQKLLSKTDDFIRAKYSELLDYSDDTVDYKVKDVLTQYKKKERVKDTKSERYISVPLYGKGIKERDLGEDDLKPFTTVRIKGGQFIYSRIWIRKGACGLVPEELEGAVVTNEFPVFDINENRVNPEFLLYAILDERFLQQIGASNTGSTSKQRLKENTFLELRLTLPPIDAQNRFSEMVRQSKEAQEELRKSLSNVIDLQKRIIIDNIVIPKE